MLCQLQCVHRGAAQRPGPPQTAAPPCSACIYRLESVGRIQTLCQFQPAHRPGNGRCGPAQCTGLPNSGVTLQRLKLQAESYFCVC